MKDTSFHQQLKNLKFWLKHTELRKWFLNFLYNGLYSQFYNKFKGYVVWIFWQTIVKEDTLF